MRDVLSHLGIKTVNARGYEAQFGISLRIQKPVEISGGIHALMAGVHQDIADRQKDLVLAPSMQGLLIEAKNTFGFNEGEYEMFIADQLNAPPSMAPVVLVAQKNSAQQTTAAREHILGICELVNLTGTGQAELSPVVYANGYFRTSTAKIDYATAKVRIIQQPKHGRIEPIGLDDDWRDIRYLPIAGYIGNDSVVLLVDGNGYKRGTCRIPQASRINCGLRQKKMRAPPKRLEDQGIEV